MLRKLSMPIGLFFGASALMAASPVDELKKECAINYHAAGKVMVWKMSQTDSTSAERDRYLKLGTKFWLRADELAGVPRVEDMPKKIVDSAEKIAGKVTQGDSDAAMGMAKTITDCNEQLGLEPIGL